MIRRIDTIGNQTFRINKTDAFGKVVELKRVELCDGEGYGIGIYRYEVAILSQPAIYIEFLDLEKATKYYNTV